MTSILGGDVIRSTNADLNMIPSRSARVGHVRGRADFATSLMRLGNGNIWTAIDDAWEAMDATQNL